MQYHLPDKKHLVPAGRISFSVGRQTALMYSPNTTSSSNSIMATS